MKPNLRLIAVRCEFGSCPNPGKRRAIAYYNLSHEKITRHPLVCDRHYRDFPVANGAVSSWLNSLRAR